MYLSNLFINNDLISGNAFQCYRCIAGMDCFKNGDIGSPVNCTAPLNTGCYKTSLTGKITESSKACKAEN